MNTSAPQNTNKSRNENVNQNIRVYVRVRPLNTREKLIRSSEIVDVASPRDIICRHSLDSKVSKKFSFDRTFGPDSKQSDVYHTVVAPLIEEVLAGYNCTVFAYGQTGTGKTHTMVGVESPELKSSWEDNSSVGIIPRALCHMLDELRLMEVEYTMRISYLELYNEELCDLLSTDDSVKIRIYDDSTKKGSVIIQGLEEVIVHGKDDVYKLLEKGQERRKTATTLMNAQSSRSHTVFSILVHIKENGMEGEEMLKIGKLNLVDLAGSENISKSGNEKGIRTRETVNINQSLLTLGRVITSLVERTPHIPYRESKLTRLLQESLGGRTKTSIIATISPGHKDIDETLSTLEYAHRAKNIQNKPEVNQKLTKKTVLKEYTEEIDRLKRDLLAARDKNGIYLAEDTYNEMSYKLETQNKELNEQILTLKAMKEEMLKKEALFNEVSSNLMEKTEELQRTEKVLNEAKFALTQTKKALNTTKKRYKEKKVILGNHIKTEEKLTGQATELIQVAEVATNDHALLQETLERRKQVDNEIKNVTGEFKNKFENSFKTMNRDFEDLNQRHKSVSKIIKDEINKNTKTINVNINNTKSKINQIATICDTAFNNFYKQYEDFTKILQDDDEKYKNKFNELYKMQKEKDEMLKNELSNYLHETTNFLKEQNEMQIKNSILISELISEGNKKDHNFYGTLNHHLNVIVEEANKAIRDERLKIKENCEKASEFKQKKNEILTKMESLMFDLRGLELDDSKTNTEIHTISENMSSIEELVSNKVNTEIETVTAFVNDKDKDLNEIQNNLEHFNKDLNLNYSKIHDKMKDVENSIGNIHMVNSEFQNKMTIMVSENIETRDEFITNNNNKLINEKLNSISSIQTEFKETESIIFENQTNFNEYSIQNTSLTKSLIEAVDEYGNQFKQKMNSNYQQLNDFYENELKIYTPTGQTPSKKEFTYPKILARTSPHCNIIKRFRLENDYSDLDISNTTISEEDMETTIIDIDNEMQMPRRSTPIKNFENSSKSIDLNIQSLSESTQNTPRLTQSLNIFDNSKNSFTDLKKGNNTPAIYITSNKENIE